MSEEKTNMKKYILFFIMSFLSFILSGCKTAEIVFYRHLPTEKIRFDLSLNNGAWEDVCFACRNRRARNHKICNHSRGRKVDSLSNIKAYQIFSVRLPSAAQWKRSGQN